MTDLAKLMSSLRKMVEEIDAIEGVTCSFGNGTGRAEAIQGPPTVTCSVCGGSGEGLPVPAVDVGEPQPEEWPPCEQCKGRGWVVVDTDTEEAYGGTD